jgi:RNA polymerase sigma-70 factor (ECF subfamily)
MNQNTLDESFESCRAQLRAYLLRITAHAVDTEDLLQDTYLKAVAGRDGFEGKSSIKTWLFTIASNLAKDHQRSRQRWTENVTDLSREAALSNRAFLQEMMEIRMTSPQGNFEIAEHIAFCFNCISKSLPLEQQLCLLLKEVYEFKVHEIKLILDTTEAMVKYHLHTGRAKMSAIFEGRCALINKTGVCHQCTELNGIFNPQQKAQEELMKVQLAREATTADKERLFDLRMEIVRGIDPFESGAATLQLRHLEHNRRVMEEYLKKKIE